MSYIPNCREDKLYNYGELTPRNKYTVDGFDWCAEEGVETFFDNLRIYQITKNGFDLIDYLESNPDVCDSLKEAILDYIEMQRNELIVSMIENDL